MVSSQGAEPYSDEKVANRNGGLEFGGGDRSRGVSRRPPISLSTIVPRTLVYTNDAKVWDLSLVGHFRVTLCQTLRYDSQLLHRCKPGGERRADRPRRAAEARMASTCEP